MNNCGTCKHWRHKDGFDFGICDAVGFDLRRDTDDPESVLEEPAYTVDGSGFAAELRTKADFGCTLWEKKQ